ncbi:hypothetical protein PVAP13_1NG341800 [Panicum virgatum]|uniref:Cyclin N-terminal domain-containing protein n=1 Tax=Panicum virgatum TaxID=38727 RepID=A0A8T0X9R1_PANVG|nr:hypothetical protein PVAP13_1NG341800 [Panicum virgatum]
MDATTSRLPSCLAPPPGLVPFSPRGGGAMMHKNPFSFGLDIALPSPASFRPFSDGGRAHATRGSNPFSFFDQFSGGGAVHTLQANPISGAAAGHALALHTNPFSFGFDLAHPPLTGNDPFSGGATLHADEDEHSNPFAQPAVDEPVSSPLLIPAPASPICDDGTCKNSTSTRAHVYASCDDDDDIEAILRAQEEDVKARPSPDYLATTQGGRMSPEMRTTLVRWMAGLTRRYDLAPVTLHRAVSYTDRFLSARPLSDTSAHRLNLLGGAAVYAAAKYEDQAAVYKLSARKIARRAGFAKRQEVIDMERALLAALDYRLSGPTAYTFVEHFTRDCSQEEGDDDLGPELRSRAHDFANVSLFHYGCLELKPSAVAAAAMLLAMRTLKPSYRQMVTLDRELEELTGYKPKDLERGVDAIRSLIPEDGGNGFDMDIFPMLCADPD